MAAAAHGGGSSGFGVSDRNTGAAAAEDECSGRVYCAVAAGESAEEVRRVIELCAQGDEQRRAQAVNHKGVEESPLQAAHRQRRGDLVGALVEAGADVGGIFDGRLPALAVCVAYGQVESVRALLRKGHTAKADVKWDPRSGSGLPIKSTLAQFCLAPTPVDPSSAARCGPVQVGCLEVLLTEGGADANALDSADNSPIFWLIQRHDRDEEGRELAAARLLVAAGARVSGVFNNEGDTPLMVAAAHNEVRLARLLLEEAGAPVDETGESGYTALHCCYDFIADATETAAMLLLLLLDAGANVDARAKDGCTALFGSLSCGKPALVRLLLDRGASVDIIDTGGRTPLIEACGTDDYSMWLDDEPWPVFQEILRRSSAKTRRSVFGHQGFSAVDLIAEQLTECGLDEADDIYERCRWLIGELLASGAPMLPKYAPVVLPIAVSHAFPVAARKEAELAARLPTAFSSWRAHEEFVALSLDFGELRAVERAVEERRARLAALEQGAGGELGVGTDSSSSSSSSSERGDEDG